MKQMSTQLCRSIRSAGYSAGRRGVLISAVQTAVRLVPACGLILLCLMVSFPASAAIYLFDASKEEVSGNADWVIDADVVDIYLEHYPCNQYGNEANAQHLPTPDHSTVTPATDETYWKGGISAWGLDLVQAGHAVATLPDGGAITWGNGTNPYDLSNFDVYIIPEPQQPFSAAEKTAILDFVFNGGGLFMVADHQTSDRNCSGWDSPHIFNDLMGVVISGGVIVDYGLFGLVFNVQEISGMTNTDYWFTDGVDNNVSTDPQDPIIHGPFGDGSGGLGFFGATSMTIDPSTNPTVGGHVWKTDAGGQGLTRVTFVTAEYGAGKIAAIGDSSPADDGTGDNGDTLYDGWDKAVGGVANDIIHLNACAWLISVPDTDPPIITVGPNADSFDCTASITWTTDEQSTSVVEYGETSLYGETTSSGGYASSHQVVVWNLSPSTAYHYRVCSDDRSGNGPTCSADDQFTTLGPQSPTIIDGPSVSMISGSSATIGWTTDEPATSIVQYGETTSYGMESTSSALTELHQRTLTGLTAETIYHYRAGSVDGCGNGPTWSSDGSFTTGPAAIDVSSWTIIQDGGAYSFSFPTGTVIPSGGYIIVARNADQAAFESCWAISLPANVVFFNSNSNGSCLGTDGCLPIVNGGESFELVDNVAENVDGVTISGSAGNAYQRLSADLPAGSPSSWSVVASSAANPGAGMSSSGTAGVVISEWSDASPYECEYVELFNAGGGVSIPDSTPPGAIGDLDTRPMGTTTIRITFTATGDDGTTGTASSYDLRWATTPIRNLDDFYAAHPLSGEPIPAAAGIQESFDVSGLLADTSYFFALRVSDEVPNIGDLSNWSGCTTAPEGTGGATPADHLVISEVRTLGPAGDNDEIIELYNPTSSAIPLGGKSVQYASATGMPNDSLKVTLSSVSLAPYHYYLIKHTSANTGTVTADQTYGSFAMGASGGKLFIVNSTVAITSCTQATVIDMVGWGSANCYEGSPAPTHTTAQSIERKPGDDAPACGNGQVTNNNSADFLVRSPSDPQNSSMSEAPCSGLGNVGRTLFCDASLLQWGKAFGALSYKIRRSTDPSFMVLFPIPSDMYLLDEVTTTFLTDTDSPAAGSVFYYFVNAVNNTDESDS